MKVINLDEIRPKQYESNIERYGEDGCIICGRPLSERDMQNGKFVHMLPNGDITDSKELDGKIPDNADLGWGVRRGAGKAGGVETHPDK